MQGRTIKERDKGGLMKKILYGVIAVLLAVVFVLGVGLAYERGHNNGYNEGWNDGTAYGWQGCIEENNLYERYGEE